MKAILVIQVLFLSCLSLIAMNPDRVSHLIEDSNDWQTLSIELINAAIETVPPQACSYTCGHTTIAHALILAGEKVNMANILATCPLSLEADIKILKNNNLIWPTVAAHISREQEQEGYLRIGAAPEQLENYFNDVYPSNKLVYLKHDQLNNIEFKELIKESLDAQLPIIVLRAVGGLSLHYELLVGLNSKDDKVMILNTGEIDRKLYIKNIDDLLISMDISPIVSFVKSIDLLTLPLRLVGIDLNSLMEQRASTNIIQNWGNICLLQMLPGDRADKKIAAQKAQNAKKQPEGCNQQ